MNILTNRKWTLLGGQDMHNGSDRECFGMRGELKLLLLGLGLRELLFTQRMFATRRMLSLHEPTILDLLPSSIHLRIWW